MSGVVGTLKAFTASCLLDDRTCLSPWHLTFILSNGIFWIFCPRIFSSPGVRLRKWGEPYSIFSCSRQNSRSWLCVPFTTLSPISCQFHLCDIAPVCPLLSLLQSTTLGHSITISHLRLLKLIPNWFPCFDYHLIAYSPHNSRMIFSIINQILSLHCLKLSSRLLSLCTSNQTGSLFSSPKSCKCCLTNICDQCQPSPLGPHHTWLQRHQVHPCLTDFWLVIPPVWNTPASIFAWLVPLHISNLSLNTTSLARTPWLRFIKYPLNHYSSSLYPIHFEIICFLAILLSPSLDH